MSKGQFEANPTRHFMSKRHVWGEETGWHGVLLMLLKERVKEEDKKKKKREKIKWLKNSGDGERGLTCSKYWLVRSCTTIEWFEFGAKTKVFCIWILFLFFSITAELFGRRRYWCLRRWKIWMEKRKEVKRFSLSIQWSPSLNCWRIQTGDNISSDSYPDLDPDLTHWNNYFGCYHV